MRTALSLPFLIFVRARLTQRHQDDFGETKDQRFLADDEFVEDIQRYVNQHFPFVYEITLEEIVSQVESILELSLTFFAVIHGAAKGPGGDRCVHI